MQEIYISDNSGNRVSLPKTANPIAGSGITIAMANNGVDYTGVVEPGQAYVVSSNGGFCLLSITGLTSVAANIEWTVNDDGKIIIYIPNGVTTLYCESDTDATNLYLAKLA